MSGESLNVRFAELAPRIPETQDGLMVAFAIVSLAAFVIAWRMNYKADTPARARTKFSVAILISALAAIVACVAAVPYGARVLRFVPERPALVETALNLGVTKLLYARALREQAYPDTNIPTALSCIDRFASSARIDKNLCQIQPQCAKFLAAEALSRTEVISVLEHIQQNMIDRKLPLHDCSSVRFADLTVKP